MSNINTFDRVESGLTMQKSRWKMPFTHTTTLKPGRLVPFYCEEVLPGDTWKVDVQSIHRLITPVVPTMDNLIGDIYFFFVPSRLCTTHYLDFEKVMGVNTNGYWAQSEEYTLYNTGNAFLNENTEGIAYPDSLASYLGQPIKLIDSGYVSALPFRAYFLIYNEFFRNENFIAPNSYAGWTTGASSSIYSLASVFNSKDSCLKPAKLPDYFTKALPAPQKGDSVLLSLADNAPVSLGDGAINIVASNGLYALTNPLVFGTSNALGSKGVNLGLFSNNSTDTFGYVAPITTTSNPTQNGNVISTNLLVNRNASAFTSMTADLSQATAMSVNDLRLSFAMQRLLEKDARGGTRYTELLFNHYGVKNQDLTLYRPEYLGGVRFDLNINQVLQTSASNATGSDTPLGYTGAVSISRGDKKGVFYKSFSEFGYIMGIVCFRAKQSYSQGFRKMFRRNRRFDWYFPTFAHIGEQAILKSEIMSGGLKSAGDVFGYTEAWNDYRYTPDRVSGAVAPSAGVSSFSAWTYTSNFDSSVMLNQQFIEDDGSEVMATLIDTDTEYPFLSQFYVDVDISRVMPVYSTPGLIDHF